jgi:pimeloyl-ACP methyl ester carboxylesterase
MAESATIRDRFRTMDSDFPSTLAPPWPHPAPVSPLWAPEHATPPPEAWRGLGVCWHEREEEEPDDRDDELAGALPGGCFLMHSPVGRLAVYHSGPDGVAQGAPLLLIHSVNLAASSYEMRPLFAHTRQHRAVYALDLPGFGRSDRPARRYTPEVMVQAIHAVVEAIKLAHPGQAVDAVALSLGCEFLARACLEAPLNFRAAAFISPTGLARRRMRRGRPQSTLEVPGLRALLNLPLWSAMLFRQLTRPTLMRYFLRRSWGSPGVDRGLLAYARESVLQPGAHHAPLQFLSGALFSGDAFAMYKALTLPVWLAHGLRGAFSDYGAKALLVQAANWRVQVFPSGALPHFESPPLFCAALDRFLDAADTLPRR